jgi:Vps51/Vps67
MAGVTMLSSGGGLAHSMAKSMTLDEMRVVHQRALRDAEAKRMELRLVLASRYRELVGSSDEVIKMNERAAELLDLVQNLPQLLDRVANAHPSAVALAALDSSSLQEEKLDVSADEDDSRRINAIRANLANFPRLIHRALYKKDVFLATTTLLDLFTLIASLTDRYPVATSLSKIDSTMKQTVVVDETLEAQMRMLFLQMESLPAKLRRDATRMLENENVDARQAAAAAAALFLLSNKSDPEALLTAYFEAKAKLTLEALGRLSQAAENAEVVLTKIVAILQMDVIIHPYQIFILRNLDVGNEEILNASLPFFDKEMVKEKCSK